MNSNKITHKGFTIIELLIVIVVIGILATIGIVSFNGVQERARTTRATEELRMLSDAIMLARINTGKTLVEITGNANSLTSKTLSDSAIDAIATASGVRLTQLKVADPWGGYYQVDENEAEFSNDVCRQDLIRASSRITTTTVLVPFSLLQCQ